MSGPTTASRPSSGSRSGSGAKPRRPLAYQKRAVEWLVGRGGAGLFARPGGRKTSITLRALLALRDAGVMRRALVIAPIRVIQEVWPVEPGAWVGSEWAGLTTLSMSILHGDRKDYALQQDSDIFLINPDGLKWLLPVVPPSPRERKALRDAGKLEELEQWVINAAQSAERWRSLEIDTLVIDESTMFKNRETKRFELLKNVLPSFRRRWILTGTPNPNGYMNLFPQMYIVDMGLALGRFITHYRQQYFYPVDMYQWRLKEGADRLIQDRIAPYVFTLQPKDYKEIPVEPNIIRVELPPKAQRVYNDLEQRLITELDSGKVVTAASAGVAAGKCGQVANGGLYHLPAYADEEVKFTAARTWDDLHWAKVDAVEELLDELNGSPALIVYEFRHDLARLLKRFPGMPYIGQGVSLRQAKTIFAEWNQDKYPGLLVHGASVSHGLNLQLGSARDVIWHSLTHDYEVFDQLNRRLARPGSRHDRVFSHLIVARDTTDEARLANLRRKGKVQDGFLEALREYAKGRRK